MLVHLPDEGGMAACQLPQSGCRAAALWTGSIASGPGRDWGEQHRRNAGPVTSVTMTAAVTTSAPSQLLTMAKDPWVCSPQAAGNKLLCSLSPLPPPQVIHRHVQGSGGSLPQRSPSQVQSLPLRGTRSSQSSAERSVKLL